MGAPRWVLAPSDVYRRSSHRSGAGSPARKGQAEMTSLTRWVLAHKRTVVVFWVVLTLIGVASAGSASKALKQKFSVPGKEGWVTNQQIARDFHGTGGNGAPLLAVVTLPAGAVGELPGRPARTARRRIAPAAHAARHAPGGLREHRTTRPSSRATGTPRSSSPTRRRTPTRPLKTTLKRPKTRARRSPARRSRARRSTSPALTRCRSRAAAATAPVCCSRRCWAASARCSCWPSCSARSWRSCRS